MRVLQQLLAFFTAPRTAQDELKLAVLLKKLFIMQLTDAVTRLPSRHLNVSQVHYEDKFLGRLINRTCPTL